MRNPGLARRTLAPLLGISLLALCLASGCLVSETAQSPPTGSQPAPPAKLPETVGNALRGVPDGPQTSERHAGRSLQNEPAAETEAHGEVRLAANTSDDTKVREELFKGWPKPRAVLFLTGQQNGYIEPCGCTGLANQKGGLARRHTMLRQLADQGWEVAPLDVGNQVRRFGRQAEIQFQMTVEGLKKMKYAAVAFGPDDLRLSAGELLSASAEAPGQPSLFIGANVAVFQRDLTPGYKVLSVGGLKIGVTAVLGTREMKEVPGDEIILQPPLEGLSAVWPKLKAEKCDLYVLLAHASLDESKALAAKFPDFDVVVTAGGAGEPTHQPEKIPNTKGVLVQVGTKGMYAGVLGLFEGPGPKLRYQRAPLDDRYADSKDMLALLASYQEQLKTAGLEKLGVKALPHPSGRKFVGSQACGECHTKAYAIWKDTPHAAATESLVHPSERSEIARHYDPECLSCHVTGWNAQKYYPYRTGYLSQDDKPLFGNGCENCHGPGSAHVAAEGGDAKLAAALKMLRAEMRLPLAEAEKRCMDCHDLDNSPDFHDKGAFEKYWKEIEHKGVD